MTEIARRPAGGKPPATTTHVRVAAQRLHDIARLVERLGVSGRLDPERIMIAKYGIAAELRSLAEGRP
jgi:hypothetical protein